MPWVDPKKITSQVSGPEIPYADIVKSDTNMSFSRLPYVTNPEYMQYGDGLWGAKTTPLASPSLYAKPPSLPELPPNPAEYDMMPTGSIPSSTPSLMSYLSGSAPANAFDRSIPASIRTNNPGAMWYAGWQNKYGVLGKQNLNDGLGQGNNIGMFPTPEAGAAAQFELLQRYGAKDWDVRKAITTWSGGNSSDQYVNSVTNKMGLSPDTKLSAVMGDQASATSLAKYMAVQEAGKTYPMSNDQWGTAWNIYQKQSSSAPGKVQTSPIDTGAKPPIERVAPPPSDIMRQQQNLGYRDALGGNLYGAPRPITSGFDTTGGINPMGTSTWMPQRPPTILSPDLPQQDYGTSAMSQMQQQMMQQQAMMSNQMAQMTQPLQAASSSAMASFNQVGSSIAQAGSQASTSTGMFGSLGNSLDQMFSQLGSAFSGGGGGGGGGGLFGGLFNMFGMFQEGGVSTAPVTALAAATSFRNMPHYSEGTDLASRAPGTPSMGGGFGAVLHDNEAVIPLTRGREVPVKMAGGRGGNGGGTTVVNMTVNGVKDVGGFNRSKSQIAASMSTAMTQATQKQNCHEGGG